MAFAINQNFDLKSTRKDFVRQELTLADLKNTRDADYPDDYTVTIGGKIYIFNSANPVRGDIGKWREYELPISPNGGLKTAVGGLAVNYGIGLSTNYDGRLDVECISNDPDPDEGWVAVHRPLSDSMPLCILVGRGLSKGSNNSLSIGTLDNTVKVEKYGIGVRISTGLKENDSGISINLGSGLTSDEYGHVVIRVSTAVYDKDSLNFLHLSADDEGAAGVLLGTVFNADGHRLGINLDNKTLMHGSEGMHVNPGNGLKVDNVRGLEVSVGTGLDVADGGVFLRPFKISKLVNGTAQPILESPFEYPINNDVILKLSTGLAVSPDGYLYVNIKDLSNV